MKRLPVNLASQPIEALLRIRKVLMLVGAFMFMATAAHGIVAWRLAVASRQVLDAGSPSIDVSAAQLRQWQREVEELVGAAERGNAREVAAAVAVANELIAWRKLPWEQLFDALEGALPDNVRLELVQPASEPGGVRVNLIAAAAAPEHLQEFLASLERVPVLSGVLPRAEEIGEDRRYRMTIKALYVTPETGGSR